MTEKTVYISLNDILERFSVKKTSVYRWISKNTFPLPIKFGTVTRWNLAEVEQWERDFIAQRTQKFNAKRT